MGRQAHGQQAGAHEIVGWARRRSARCAAAERIQLRRRRRRRLLVRGGHRPADADRRRLPARAAGQGGDPGLSQGPPAAHPARAARPPRHRGRRGRAQARHRRRAARLRDRARRAGGSGALPGPGRRAPDHARLEILPRLPQRPRCSAATAVPGGDDADLGVRRLRPRGRVRDARPYPRRSRSTCFAPSTMRFRVRD